MRSSAGPALGARSSGRAREDDDDGSDDAREVEQRRREYLQRHREMLLQKQRLETERRLQEHERDAAAIQKRIDDVRAAKQQEADQADHARTSAPLLCVKERDGDAPMRLPGIYARMDELSPDALRLVADQQALRDLAPLNTRGKYHTRFMKDRYPIAGSQLKLERERELFLGAKKKLLLESAAAGRAAQMRSSVSSNTDNTKASLMRTSLSLGSGIGRTYRKLDFYSDKMTSILKTEEQSVAQAHAERQVRLVDVQHELGLQQFWTLLHSSHTREVVAWLRAHTFRDVNVPVRLVIDPKPSGSATESNATAAALQVIPDRVFGTTPLMAACKCQCPDMVHALFEHGAVVHLVTANGDAALHFLWRQWLAPGAETTSTSSASASMKAVVKLSMRAQSTLAILTALIDHGADVNAQNDFGETALQVCARFGLEACAKLLLAHCADAFARDRHGKSAVDYAREHKHEALHRLLLNYDIIERTRARESERRHCEALLKRGRGVLSATWSQSPAALLARLEVQEQRAGHLRSQYVDRDGHVLVCDDDDDDSGSA